MKFFLSPFLSPGLALTLAITGIPFQADAQLPSAPPPQAAPPEASINLEQLKEIGILPEEKLAMRPEQKLDPKKPNPFAERSKPRTPAAAVQSVETEEMRIRRVFDALTISGITKSGGKYTALLGDMILEEAAVVPPVIPDQTQILRVTRITDSMVELSWVEQSGNPRKILKRVELKPRVGIMLGSQNTEGAPGKTGTMAYLDENGKLMWPSKMAPNLQGVISPMPGVPNSTAAAAPPPGLPEEEGGTPGPDGSPEVEAGDFTEPPGSSPAPPATPSPAPDAAPAASPAPGSPDNSSSALEDPVQPPAPEAPPASGS